MLHHIHQLVSNSVGLTNRVLWLYQPAATGNKVDESGVSGLEKEEDKKLCRAEEYCRVDDNYVGLSLLLTPFKTFDW